MKNAQRNLLTICNVTFPCTNFNKQCYLRLCSLLVLLVSIFGMSHTHAAVSPIGLGIIPPVQFPTEDTKITGARVSALWGNHRAVYGLDIGVIGNMTSLNFGGAAVAGVFNYNKGATTVLGLQAAGLANINVNKASITGVQVAGLFNSNKAVSSLLGFQLALIANVSSFTQVIGGQVGLYNTAREVYGLQIGLVNVTEVLHGLQIGLVNINKMGLFRICPLINFGF